MKPVCPSCPHCHPRLMAFGRPCQVLPSSPIPDLATFPRLCHPSPDCPPLLPGLYNNSLFLVFLSLLMSKELYPRPRPPHNSGRDLKNTKQKNKNAFITSLLSILHSLSFSVSMKCGFRSWSTGSHIIRPLALPQTISFITSPSHRLSDTSAASPLCKYTAPVLSLQPLGCSFRSCRDFLSVGS